MESVRSCGIPELYHQLSEEQPLCFDPESLSFVCLLLDADQEDIFTLSFLDLSRHLFRRQSPICFLYGAFWVHLIIQAAPLWAFSNSVVTLWRWGQRYMQYSRCRSTIMQCHNDIFWFIFVPVSKPKLRQIFFLKPMQNSANLFYPKS